MFKLTKEELLKLLSIAFDEGYNGYQDLKDCFISKIVEDLEIKQKSSYMEDIYFDLKKARAAESQFQSMDSWRNLATSASDLLQRQIEDSLYNNYPISMSSNYVVSTPYTNIQNTSVN